MLKVFIQFSDDVGVRFSFEKYFLWFRYNPPNSFPRQCILDNFVNSSYCIFGHLFAIALSIENFSRRKAYLKLFS